MKGSNRLYMVLVEEWASSNIEHNQLKMFEFKPWCLRTYGVDIISHCDYHFDDANKELMFKLKYGDLL